MLFIIYFRKLFFAYFQILITLPIITINGFNSIIIIKLIYLALIKVYLSMNCASKGENENFMIMMIYLKQ